MEGHSINYFHQPPSVAVQSLSLVAAVRRYITLRSVCNFPQKYAPMSAADVCTAHIQGIVSGVALPLSCYIKPGLVV